MSTATEERAPITHDLKCWPEHFAAAPDLYEACVRLLALADTLPIKHPQQADVRDLARAALAKACPTPALAPEGSPSTKGDAS